MTLNYCPANATHFFGRRNNILLLRILLLFHISLARAVCAGPIYFCRDPRYRPLILFSYSSSYVRFLVFVVTVSFTDPTKLGKFLATTLLAYTDAVALRSPNLQFTIILFSLDTTDTLDSFLSIFLPVHFVHRHYYCNSR